MSERNEYIRSITEIMPDDFPTLTPLPEGSVSSNSTSSSSSFLDFFSNITWQTWVIIVLVLALIGINVFVYLAKGTQETASIFQQIFGPILKFFGYSTLETTKQTVETSATGTKAGVDIVAGATTGAINTVEQTAQNGYPTATSGTSTGVSTSNSSVQGQQVQGQQVQGQQATSSLPVQERIQQAGGNIDQWQEDSLEKALSSASQSVNQVNPDDSRSSIQTTGKAGWCFIGEDQGIRTCAEIGVNDGCMSGDVFPSQEICMNPNLRA
jgi:hypothetical protein